MLSKNCETSWLGKQRSNAAASWHLEKLHNLFDNYGIPWMPFEATRARIQRMYRAWNVPGADVALSGEPEDQASSVPERANITMHACGGRQARICQKTGLEHDMSAVVLSKDGGSVACKDCGVTAMSLDLMELP